MQNCFLNKEKTKKVKCPECFNYMILTAHNNGYSGQCSVCRSVIFSKQHTPKEKLIKIIKA